MRRAVLLGLSVLLWNASPLQAQTAAAFGTCAFWQEETRPDDRKSSAGETYRIGFTHGFVLGMIAPPGRALSGPSSVLDNQLQTGLDEALQRPAFLIEAFDQKCGDYRNRRVMLYDVGVLILLEIGGISGESIESALEIMRGRGSGDAHWQRVVEALVR